MAPAPVPARRSFATLDCGTASVERIGLIPVPWPIRFPAPLRPGDRVAVTSPSKGVGRLEQPRFDRAVEAVRARGYEVVIGACMDGSSYVSAPAAERAAELTNMLADPAIRAVVPPRGGETAIDVLPLMDWDAIVAARPTWFAGFSDISTLLMPMTLRTAIATLHGSCLMNTPYRIAGPRLTWLDVAALEAGASFRQSSLDARAAKAWIRLDGDSPVEVTGRLIGGCIETIRHLIGTPYGDVARFAHEQAPEGLIVYLEAASDDAFAICRSLHGMRLAGFFADATAILIARTIAPGGDSFTQRDAVLDALSQLGVPIIAELGCGHVPPYLPIVNGALGHLEYHTDAASLTQSLT
jgi:muramoyltetrapeptide carboxypeptidase LdcA involved in peptidoglycan recycling